MLLSLFVAIITLVDFHAYVSSFGVQVHRSKRVVSQTERAAQQKKKPRFSQAIHPADDDGDALLRSITPKHHVIRQDIPASSDAFVKLQIEERQPKQIEERAPKQIVERAPKQYENQGWGNERPRPARKSKRTAKQFDLSEKSIEDLEARLAKKFGTDLSVLSSQDFDGDDDDDEEYGEMEEVTYRGNPVLDPWAKEDLLLKKSNGSATSNSPLASFGLPTPEQQDEKVPSRDIRSHDENTSPLTAFGAPRSEPTSDKEGVVTDEVKPTTKVELQQPLVPVIYGDAPLHLTLDFAQKIFDDSVVEDTADEEAIATEKKETSWHDIGITNEVLIDNLEEMGCACPLAVQRNSCPSIVDRKDVVVGTYTGSGKTLAFLVPAIQHISTMEPGFLRLLVVAPGRELASQIVSVAREVVEGTGLTVQLAIGGTTFSRNLEQIRKRKPDILIGTPGRIAELIVGTGEKRRGRLATHHLETVVLDEFDALLEYKPHRDPTHGIMEFIRRQRRDRLQAILCSATATDMLKEKKRMGLEENYLLPGYVTTMADKNDALVTSTDNGTRVSKTVLHGVVHVPHRRYVLNMLRKILHSEPFPQQILIFVSDSRRVKIVVDKLHEMGIIAAPLHGDNEKSDRADVNRALREGYVGIVVATELAARGLDAPLLTHVINLDLPTDASHYAHRAGRCGRGGRPGVVINLTTSPQERKVPHKLTSALGVDLHSVLVRDGKLHVVDPESIILD